MRDDPPNPYKDLPLHRLADAMGERAGQLLKGDRVGRRDVAYLLISGASPLRPAGSHAVAPNRRVAAGDTAAQVYGDVYEADARTLRYYVVQLAIDAIGLRPPYQPPSLYASLDVLRELAQRDEAGLYEALDQLEGFRPTPAQIASAADKPRHE